MTASAIPQQLASRTARGALSAPPVRLEEDWAEPPLHFRLVLARDKRDRLEHRARTLAPRRACTVGGCAAEGLAVLLIDSELEALLCPFHQLVHLDGTPVPGEPVLAAAGW